MYPPSEAYLQIIVEDIREEVKKKMQNPRWSGGTIPSNYKPYFADVDDHGHFRKIYYLDGNRREFFNVTSAITARTDGKP